MWQVLLAGMRTYAPWVTFPFAVVVGAVGYTIERTIRSDNSQAAHVKSIAEEREERQLAESVGQDCTNVESLKEKKGIPRTVLDRNAVSR
ncbi:small integral membrane protein 12-like [Diadema setosum]|uniref:small integral membrane protein 12-like n=1 Tax=Diadema setosum TaxID=31175 RepID=UPI003B3B529C